MEQENKILYLPLKRKWFEMIKSGEKKEEYREVTMYWKKRLAELYNSGAFVLPNGKIYRSFDICGFKSFTQITFTLGYPKLGDPERTATFKCEGITTGRGKPEWGAPDSHVFIIKIGERIK